MTSLLSRDEREHDVLSLIHKLYLEQVFVTKGIRCNRTLFSIDINGKKFYHRTKTFLL